MIRLIVALVAAAVLTGISPASANSCGPGCHNARNGECVVNGWEMGAAVRNECPAGARPRPPCGEGYVWRRPEKTCVLR
jgi:hypothetical protein